VTALLPLVCAVALSAAPAAAAAPASAATARAADPEAKARAWFTDTVLVTQDGKPVRFYSDVLANKVVAIDFIFTRCDMACPLLTEKLNRVREEIGPLFGKEVFFVSISMDPEFDTPQELAKFAKKHSGLRPGWTWLTGKKADVELVVKRLGEWVDDKESHSTEFIVGNSRTRHWMKVRPDAPPTATALQLKALVEENAAKPSAVSAASAARVD
jgi:protein SCO1/2